MTSSTTPNPNPCPAQTVPPLAAIAPLLRVMPPSIGRSTATENARS